MNTDWSKAPEWATVAVMSEITRGAVFLDHNVEGRGGRMKQIRGRLEGKFDEDHKWYKCGVISRRPANDLPGRTNQVRAAEEIPTVKTPDTRTEIDWSKAPDWAAAVIDHIEQGVVYIPGPGCMVEAQCVESGAKMSLDPSQGAILELRPEVVNSAAALQDTRTLFELDVALFGREAALSMWDVSAEETARVGREPPTRPYIAPQFKCRRREGTPSIWVKAPNWADSVAEHLEDSGRFMWLGERGAIDVDGMSSTTAVSDVGRHRVVARRPEPTVSVTLQPDPQVFLVHEKDRYKTPTAIYHAGEYYPSVTLLLQEPELIVWRDADGQLHHAPARDVQINPDRDGLAAEVLSRMTNADVAPEHIAELRAQGLV